MGPVAAGIKTDYIGIGSWKTWHGSPDARVKGSEVIRRNVSLLRLDVEEYEKYEEYDSDGESDDTRGTDGATSSVEAKLRFTDQNFSQLVATSVVSSFTESRLHPDQQPLVPTILVDLTQIRVCFYDCKLDVLLISEPKLLTNKKMTHCQGVPSYFCG